VLADDPPLLADYDAMRIGMHLDRTPERTCRYRVLVVVESHEAVLGDGCLHRAESIERANIANELRPLTLERSPDRLRGQLRMGMHLGVGDA
jgi:hypothetical protein